MAVDMTAGMAKPSRRSQADDSQTSAPESTPEFSSADGYDRDRVATRAYELYMERGGGDGSDMEDWFTAEREFSITRDPQAAENLRDSDD